MGVVVRDRQDRTRRLVIQSLRVRLDLALLSVSLSLQKLGVGSTISRLTQQQMVPVYAKQCFSLVYSILYPIANASANDTRSYTYSTERHGISSVPQLGLP